MQVAHRIDGIHTILLTTDISPSLRARCSETTLHIREISQNLCCGSLYERATRLFVTRLKGDALAKEDAWNVLLDLLNSRTVVNRDRAQILVAVHQRARTPAFDEFDDCVTDLLRIITQLIEPIVKVYNDARV